MVKVVVASLRSHARRQKAPAKVKTERVRDLHGQLKTVRTIDAGSATFGDELRYVFSRNVVKARKENKKTIGANDVSPER